MLVKEEEKENIRIDYKINTDETLEEVGVAEVYLNDELITSEKIYQRLENSEKKEGFWQKFLRWLFKW